MCRNMLDPRVGIATCGGDDVAFGDDLKFVPQPFVFLQAIAQNGLGGIAAINVGLINGCDALRQAGVDLRADMCRRGVAVVADAPHAVDDAAEAHVALQS